MDVTKTPPIALDAPAGRGDSALRAVVDSGATTIADARAAAVDDVHITPLDLGMALRILIAEVQAALPLPGDPDPFPPLPPPPLGIGAGASVGAGSGAGAAVLAALLGADSPPPPATVPQGVMQLFLDSLPPDGHAPAVLTVVVNVEGAVRTALDKAVDAVAAWHAAPPVVVDAVKDVRTAVIAAFRDEPPDPLWLRPEWLGLAPRMERFWRRRRFARRTLRDPDAYPGRSAAADEQLSAPHPPPD